MRETEKQPPVQITSSQWRRILGKRKIRVLVDEKQREWAGKNARHCLSCDHASDVRGDPRRGWCIKHRFMVGNTFPVLCREYS